MAVIHRDELTTAELKTIEQHSDGYHACAEFWRGFSDHQHDRRKPHEWLNSEAGEAWSYGMEAAMRVRLGRTPWPWDEYDRDDSDSLKQLASLRAVNKELRKKAAT
jgi:hypothetical protein